MQPFDNSPIAIMGQVNNYDGEIAVFVNDEQVFVDSTGLFTASYTPKAAPMIATPTEAPVASTDPAVTPDPATTPDPAATTEASTTPEGSLEDAEATEAPVTTEETRRAERCYLDQRNGEHHHRSAQKQLRHPRVRSLPLSRMSCRPCRSRSPTISKASRLTQAL